MSDNLNPTTRRAIAIRESTGVPWEIACQRAERERDERRERTLTRQCREAGMCAGPVIRAMVEERDALRVRLGLQDPPAPACTASIDAWSDPR